MKHFKVWGVVGFTSLLAGCLMPRSTSWSNPEFGQRPIGKTMIWGVAEQAATSRLYEGYFVGMLSEMGYEAVSLHQLLKPREQVEEAALEAFLKSEDFDSIIVTRVVSGEDRSQYVRTGIPGDQYENGYYGYYLYGSASMGYVQNVSEARLETTLYDVKTKQLVWTGQKTLYATVTDDKNIVKLVHAVVRELKTQQLLGK